MPPNSINFAGAAPAAPAAAPATAAPHCCRVHPEIERTVAQKMIKMALFDLRIIGALLKTFILLKTAATVLGRLLTANPQSLNGGKCPHNGNLHQVYGAFGCCVTRKTHGRPSAEPQADVQKERDLKGEHSWAVATRIEGWVELDQIRKFSSGSLGAVEGNNTSGWS